MHSKPIQKMMWKNIGKYYAKYSNFSAGGSHFGASCLARSRCSAFCSQPVVRNLGRYPLGPILASSDVLHLLSKFSPNVKDSGATNGTNHTFNKQAKIQRKNNHNQSKQNIAYFCCLTKPRKSEAPGRWVGGAPEAISI